MMHMIDFQPTGKPIYMTMKWCNYVLGKRAELAAYVNPGWCYDCHAFNYCAYLPSLAALDQEIESAFDPTSGLYQRAKENASQEEILGMKTSGDREARIRRHIEAQLDRLQALHNWRAARVSPPKCLSCGSTHIMQFPYEEEVKSPCSEGTLKWCIICADPWSHGCRLYLTPEGDRHKLRNLLERFRTFRISSKSR